MKTILIEFESFALTAILRDTPTATKILNALPFEANCNTWGDEIYFSAPITANLESDAKDVVESGELAFWTEGNCIAIGFGPTPISTGSEIRLAAKTNIWADCSLDSELMRTIIPGATVKLSILNEHKQN